jgi:hypothetical protein
MHRFAMSLFRRPALLLPFLSLAALAVPPEIGELMPPQAEEPRVIAEKDIPEDEKVFSTDVIEDALHGGNAEALDPVQKPDSDPVAFDEQGSHRAFRLKCHTVFGISTIGFA